MTLGEVLERVSGPDRIQIRNESGDVLFKGYRGLFDESIGRKDEVTKISFFQEVFRKENRREALASTEGNVPLPDMIQDVQYGDLERCTYHLITIKK